MEAASLGQRVDRVQALHIWYFMYAFCIEFNVMQASAFFFFLKLSVSFCSVGISLTGGACSLSPSKSLTEAAGQWTISKYIFARVYVLYMPVCSHLSLHVKIQEYVHFVCRFL